MNPLCQSRRWRVTTPLMVAPRIEHQVVPPMPIKPKALQPGAPFGIELTARAQKYSFKANWISRESYGASRVDPISPKVPLPKVPSGLGVKLVAPETPTTPLPPNPG